MTKILNNVGNDGLIRGGATLKAEIAKGLKVYGNVHARLHVLAVSAMLNAAVDGQPDPLTQIYDGLTKADKSAFKVWVSKLAGVGPLPGGAADKGFIDMKNDKFYVVKGTLDQRKVFEAGIQAVLDGRKFSDKSQDAGAPSGSFGCQDAIKRMETLLKAMRAVDADVSADQIEVVAKALEGFKALVPAPVVQ